MTNLRPAMKAAGTAFDLTGLMNTLLRRNDKVSRAAGNALRNLRDAESAIHDITIALELILYLKGTDKDGIPRRVSMPAAIIGACFSQAILLYIRATEEGSDRRSLKIKAKLNDAQKVTHERLKTLRNKVIAHLDNDRSYGSKSFVDQKIVVVHNGDGQHRLQLADRRLVFQDEVESELAVLLENAFELCKHESSERQNDAARLVSELSKTDQRVRELIEAYPFDAYAFFGNSDVAEGFLFAGSMQVSDDNRATQFSGWPDPA